MSGSLETAFDLLIAAALVLLALAVLFVPGLYRATVLFITFGLVLAFAWMRIDAFDIALAEAAIGAGLLGALLVGAAHQFEGRARGSQARDGGDDAAS